MAHPYPPHLRDFSYVGKYCYCLEFTTDLRAPLFVVRAVIDLVLAQILRAARERGFVVIAYCFMPDHLHLIVEGIHHDADCKAFIKAAKQYSGYYFAQTHKRRLWQRFSYERVIRDEMELALTIRYLLANPVRASLVTDPRQYAGLGSERHTIEELMQISDYSEATLVD